MNCKVNVLNNYSGMQISIPSKALIEQMGEYFVYKIDSGNIVKQKRVQLGPSQEDKVVVKNGLNPGDRIVLEGIQKVHEGSPVTMSGSLDKNKNEQGSGAQKKRTRVKRTFLKPTAINRTKVKEQNKYFQT